jgi:hypothetical protein
MLDRNGKSNRVRDKVRVKTSFCMPHEPAGSGSEGDGGAEGGTASNSGASGVETMNVEEVMSTSSFRE